MLLYLTSGFSGSITTPPASMTQRTVYDSTNNYVYDKLVAAGASGTINATQSVSDSWTVNLVSLNAAPGVTFSRRTTFADTVGVNGLGTFSGGGYFGGDVEFNQTVTFDSTADAHFNGTVNLAGSSTAISSYLNVLGSSADFNSPVTFHNPVAFSADMSYGGESLGRGTVLFEQITSVVSTTTSLTEQALHTTASIAWQPGRAYEVILIAQLKSSVSQSPTVRLRKTNASGTILVEGPRVAVGLTPNDYQAIRHNFVVNDNGSVVNAALAVCITPAVATVVSINSASGASSTWIRVTDVGQSVAGGGSIIGVSV
jgi:hypothetical protein